MDQIARVPIPTSDGLDRHQERLRQARERAGWHLGDPSWADMFISAYLDPEADADDLEEAQR